MSHVSNWMWVRLGAGAITALLVVGVPPAQAQTAPPPAPAAPAPPPPLWTGSAGFGWSLTSGNTDTSNINLSFDAVRDPKTRTVLKFEALYLRGDKDNERTVDRTGFGARIQYALSPRAYAFGQLQFLRDTFKDIDYLWAPGGGIGYKVVDTPRVALSADTGLGVVFEKNPGFDVDTSASYTLGDKLAIKLTETATFTQSYSGLWKFSDFGDSIHAFGVGLAASVSSRAQLKIELLDTYKNKPTSADIEKNDVSFLTSLVFKF